MGEQIYDGQEQLASALRVVSGWHPSQLADLDLFDLSLELYIQQEHLLLVSKLTNPFAGSGKK